MAHASSNRNASSKCSGSWLVAGMIGFGLLLTGLLYVYTWLHTAPFREMTATLTARWPDSTPRIDGGKPRLDQPGEMILRVTMRTPFDPIDEAQSHDRAREVIAAIQHQDEFKKYDTVELHLYHGDNERSLSKRIIRMRIDELE